MRLRPEQLASHLQRQDFLPVYFVSGDEPLQKLECIDQLRSVAREQGYEERIVFNADKGFDWNSLNQEAGNMSLFASRRIIELRMGSPKPGKEGGQAIQEYMAQASPDNLLLISSDKMDKSVQNNKWVKTIEKQGALIQIWPVSPAQLPGWIQNRMQINNKRISLDAARLIAQRVEGNLLAARQEIDKLTLLIDKDDIQADDVMTAVADSARYDVFDMIESAYLGDSSRTLLMLEGLRKEGVEPLALFGAFMWEFRRACSIAYEKTNGVSLEKLFADFRIWDKKKRAYSRFLQQHTCKKLQHLLTYCAQIDRTLKSANKDDAWNHLHWLLLAVAGIEIKGI